MKKRKLISAFIFLVIMNTHAQNLNQQVQNQLSNRNENFIPQQVTRNNFNWNNQQKTVATPVIQQKTVVVNTNKPPKQNGSGNMKTNKTVNRQTVQKIPLEVTSNKINNLPEVNEQVQNQIANGNQSSMQQVIILENVNFDNRPIVNDNLNRGNEQVEANTNSVYPKINLGLGEIKKLVRKQKSEKYSFKISKRKKINQDIKRYFFRVSRKLDSTFARHIKIKADYTCFAW
ncbi:MAG: hypothetical protein A3F72_09205 [Bacteroidetes bacterium RIFCSPLOWO2_12_FULL_35_15]|nr:MAG: hypothetical protein A3F72_09205 [Bacteroidetes bacterium RIFCSPLOWO2_12_FULL_35_15]